jgi:hypothetical protein
MINTDALCASQEYPPALIISRPQYLNARENVAAVITSNLGNGGGGSVFQIGRIVLSSYV